MAIAHKILVAAYHFLAAGLEYADLGDAYLDRRNETASRRALVKRLQAMGYTVTIEKRSPEGPAAGGADLATFVAARMKGVTRGVGAACS